MKKFCFAAVAAIVVASGASAASFTYSATFDQGNSSGRSIVGSFDGDLNGNVITNLSNITAVLNGVAFNMSGSLYGSHYDSNIGFVSGGAVASLDGTENNFLFIDSDYPNDTNYSNYYYSLVTTGNGDFAYNAGNYAYSNGNVTTFTATEVQTAAVPEPASWAMMVGGFGLLGATMRRRRTAVSFA